MRSQKTHNCDDGQQSTDQLFPVEANPTQAVEHCDQALQFDFVLAHVPGVENPAANYLSRLDINHEDRIHLKLNDHIPVHQIEIDLAAKTPKQGDDEEDYDSDQQQPDTTTTTTQNQPEATALTDDFAKRQSLLNSLASNHHQHNDERLKMIQLISRHLEPVLAGDAPSIILTRFTR